MTPFQPADLPDEVKSAAYWMSLGSSKEEAEDRARFFADQIVFMNDLYQVNVRKVEMPFGPTKGDMLHLSIKRRDKQSIHDWRHLQQIKNMVVGPECEAMELYPAESRLVDTANQYHLWVFVSSDVRFPIGWHQRLVLTPEELEAQGDAPNAVQRPFEDAS